MLQAQARGPMAHNSIVISPDGFRLVKLRQNDATTSQGNNKKLGFSLRGGREATGSSVGVFVSHVELAGQASKNGLKVGDQLIQVNGLQVSQATYEEVIELIRRTPKCDEICLLVKYVGKIPFQERTGQPIRWLQIELEDSDGHNNENCSNPSADEPHLLMLNDLDGETKLTPSSPFQQIDIANERLKISPTGGNGAHRTKRVSNYQDDSAASSQSLTFTSGASSSCSGASIKDGDYDEEEEAEITLLQVEGVATREEEEEACQMVSSAASSSSGCSISMSSVQSSNSSETAPPPPPSRDADQATPVLVRVPGGRRTSEPFGCGVVKGPDEWPGIFVQNVKPASLAARVGLEPGDQLVGAGEQRELSELPFEEAIALIKSLQQQQDELLLLVRKGAALRHLAECKSHHRQQPHQHDLKSQQKPALNQQAAAARRRKPVEPPPAPPSRQQQQQVETAAESESCAQQQQQQQQQQQKQQVGHQPTKSFKGDSQPTRGKQQKQADSSIRFDGGAASGPGEQEEEVEQQQRPCQRRQTTMIGNAKSQQQQQAESPPSIECARENDDERAWHAKPEDKNKQRPRCTKTIRTMQARMPQAAAAAAAATANRQAAENVVQTQECSAERAARECQCDTLAGQAAPSPQPPEDRLPSSTLEARQQRAPIGAAAGRPPCSSPVVAPSNGGCRRQRTQQVAASDNDDAPPPSSSSSPLVVVNQMPLEHQSPRSMKLNYDSGEERAADGQRERKVEEGAAAAAAANQRDEPVSPASQSMLLSRNDRLQCCQLSSAGAPNQVSNANLLETGGCDGARAASENQGSQEVLARGNKQETKTTMTRLAARPHALANVEDTQDELQREEIKIVKQNCKLHHHNSMHSLVNSRLFQSSSADLKAQNCGVDAAKVIKSGGKTHKAPPPPPPARSLQRYVSMDNLSGPQQQQQQIMQHNHLMMLHQQQTNQMNRYKRLGCHQLQTSRQKSVAPQPPSVISDSEPPSASFYRRSNSVLGQPVAPCCPLLAPQQKHQLQLLRDPRAMLLAEARLVSCNCQKCQYDQQRQPAVLISKTMRHAPRAGGGPPPMRSCGSVTLSKFKARSEDKLNLMHMNLKQQQQQQQQQQAVVVPASCTSSGSARLVRLQQARLAAEQQARQQSAFNKRHPDSAAWLATSHQHQVPSATSDACCSATSSKGLLLRPVACLRDPRRHPAPPQLVYNYATATGMIAAGHRAGMSSATSCCAINELTGEQLSRARKSNRTSEFLMLEQRLIMQRDQQHQQRRHSRVSANQTSCGAATCCSCCCSSSLSSSSIRTIKSSQTTFRACKSTQPSSGTSTDSSGYQSTSGGDRPPPPATPSQQRDTRSRLSTFNPLQPCATSQQTKTSLAAVQGGAKSLSSTPSIEISSCGSSGSLGSATCSPSSSSTSSSCSPLCSPLSSPHYLSSTSSCGSTACGSGGGGGGKLPPASVSRTAGHYEVSAATRQLGKLASAAQLREVLPKPKLLRGKLLGGGVGPALATPSKQHIPCPPPMPLLDDNTQTLRAPTAPAGHKKQQQRRQSSESGQTSAVSERVACKPTGGGGGGKSNKLCFVDELKMLASQQAAAAAATSESTNSGGHKGASKSRGAQQQQQQAGESATLIKIINANKQSAAQQSPRSNKCSCCPAATAAAGSECSSRACDCNLSAAPPLGKSKRCYPASASGKSAANGGCHRGGRAPLLASQHSKQSDGSSSSAASKLRDEEYTKRRQHELLMEEFKTAHSKMFNKLRQKQTDNNEQRQEIAGDVYDDDLDDENGDGHDHVAANAQSTSDDVYVRQQQQLRSSTATAGNLASVRPRTTVATN